jgi:hypothetical protein
MKKKLTTLLTVTCIISLTSCNSSQLTKFESAYEEEIGQEEETIDQIENANWLIGSWQNEVLDGTIYESWVFKNDSTLVGESSFVVGSDTLFSETISLEQNGNALYYIPTVQDQNDGQPVRFTLTSSTEDQLIFDNPEHDFPQKISYHLIRTDSLCVRISGEVEGHWKQEVFPFIRMNK